jgi:hypothetical protein
LRQAYHGPTHGHTVLIHIDQLKMAQSVHDESVFLRDHSYPGRERRPGMKLALDVWYEAWGRTGDRDAAGAVGHGEARLAARTVVSDGARRDRVGRHRREAAGDVSPPPFTGL